MASSHRPGIAVSLMRDTAGISVGWTEWAVGFLPVGLALFLSLPAVAYVVYPPDVKVSARLGRLAS